MRRPETDSITPRKHFFDFRLPVYDLPQCFALEAEVARASPARDIVQDGLFPEGEGEDELKHFLACKAWRCEAHGPQT